MLGLEGERGLARYWKTSRREGRGGKKSERRDNGKIEEIRDSLSINPYKMEMMQEE
jgi:hypothetical protein